MDEDVLVQLEKDLSGEGGEVLRMYFKGNPEGVKAWERALIDDINVGIRTNPDALQNISNSLDEGLDAIDAIQDAIQASGKPKPTWPEIKARFKRGNDFNRKGYAHHGFGNSEIRLGNGKRVDAYIPGDKIISRKATDLDKIQESTWRNYCNELITKYKVGTPVNSTKMPGEPPLSGKYYIEIPASNQSAQNLQDFRNIAKNDYGIEDILFLEE